MEELLQNISSISWWSTVVVAGVIVNLGAAYLKPLVDKSLSKYSKKRQIALEEKSIKRREEIQNLIDSSEERILQSQRALSRRIKGITHALNMLMLLVLFQLTLGMSVVISIFLGVFCALSGILMTSYINQSWQAEELLNEAKNRANGSETN